MKSVARKPGRTRAFTIIELLTVMSIIVILIGLLLPSLNMVRKYAMKVKQMTQLNSIQTAVELFSNECSGYPPSNALDSTQQAYCGALKLCEAMVGQDLLGYHSNSVFRADGMDVTGTYPLYPIPATEDNIRSRKGPFIPLENARPVRLQDIYGSNTSPFLGTSFVLCDVYEREMASGEKVGMPILYYKANTANSLHDPNLAPTPVDARGNIYNYWDNNALVRLGKPWEAGGGSAQDTHMLADPVRFYRNTQNHDITTVAQPFRKDTFILISAGYDGEYGTADDICNFDWRYME